jgi:hypothetical protein
MTRTELICQDCGTTYSVEARKAAKSKYCSVPCHNHAKSVSRETRLWRRVDRSAGPDACWPWIGRRMAYGYGLLPATARHKAETTHRLAWSFANNQDPGELVVMHTCDNPPCCNPKHLVLGTRGENNRDSKSKGRNARGDKHGNSSLTTADVLSIRRRKANGDSTSLLASEFSVGVRTINKIVRRTSWQHLPPQPTA